MLIVVALGGNALLRRGEPPTAASQRANVEVAAAGIAKLARTHRVVVTHGNGPQIGLLALQNAAYEPVAAYPLDILGAETEGMVGYLIEQELARHLGSDHVVTLLTQVVVDPADPAFDDPQKFVGPVYERSEAEAVAKERGWSIRADGSQWRRVVASPDPKRLVEIAAVRLLVQHRVTVVCSGGGGIPVVEGEDGSLEGVEAVVDKDLSAALLAESLGADALILLTDVDAIYEDFGQPTARPIHEVHAEDLRRRALPAGSMGPKAEAMCRFVEAGGTFAAVGSLSDAAAIAEGSAGTVVRNQGQKTLRTDAAGRHDAHMTTTASERRSHDPLGLIRLTDDDCWRMLRKHSIGRVAIVDGGAPLVFPVNYAVDNQSVVFRAGPGTKLRRAGAHAQAVFEIDDAFDVLETGSSVMVHGSLEIVEDPQERAALEKLGLRAWAPGDRDVFIRVVPQWVSGRRIQAHTDADGLGTDGG